MFFPYYMKPGHIASSAVDYLARKKGLILNSSDISKTILANVEAAEHKGVVVPEGTTVGYVLTVQDNMSSGWQVSTGDLLLISPNIWEKRQEFRTPPVVTYAYNDYSSTSTQIPTTQVVHNIIDTKIQSAGLNQLLSLDSVAYNKSMTLQSSTRTSTWSSSELSIGTTISSTIYSMNRLQTNGLYTISSPLQGITVEGKVYFDSGVTFAVPPQSNADPIVGNDLATKAYVDTLIGNYSGTGVNLYMNTGGVLGTVIGSGDVVIETTGITESTFIAQFTTPANYPNTTVIPSGIWNMTLYGNLNLDTKIIKYYFELWKVTEGGIEVLLHTSGEGEDVNTLSSIPEIHRINLSLTEPHTILVSDRIRIKIYAKSSDSEGVTLNTFFGGDYYSYLTTSLSGGLSILTMTNNFTATNKFIQEIKAEGGITTTTVFGTQMVATSISTGSLSSNSMSVVGTIVSNGGVETTTLQTSGLITSSNGILATGNGISVTGGGIATTTLNSVGLITAQNGVIISGGLTVSGADGITTTKLYSTGTVNCTALTASGLITASHVDGITTTKLHSVGAITTQSTISASGLITASHADGMTTTKLHSVGAITTQSTVSASGLITASHADGITTTRLYASGLITASHADGMTTTKLHSVGAITTQSTVSASGLITASHADGITTTRLYASGLITASHSNGITTTELYTTGIVTFGSYLPYCTVIPGLDKELTNKKYVDTLVDNYTGNGLRMYLSKTFSFNPNPITSSSTYELNTKNIRGQSYSWIYTPGSGTKVRVASFVTDVYSVNTTFPAGWWSMVIYQTAQEDSGSATYTFTLNRADDVGDIVGNQIGGESIQAINDNSTSEFLRFRSSTSFTSFTIPANTRLRLNLYVNVSSNVYTIFDGEYASYIQTPLPITSAPNTWTGKNTFSAGLTSSALITANAGLTVTDIGISTTTLNASSLITATAGLTVSGSTATFTTYTPQCSIESTIDAELTNKAYVDKNMISYTGNGLSMYFNIIGTISSPIVNPMTSPITYELNPIMYPVLASPSSTYYTLQTTGSGTKTLIASFITSPFKSSFYIQEGIWSMVLYGAVSSATGTATYSFQIRKTDSSGQQDAGTIGSESSSTIDVNALSSVAPGMYQCSTRIPSSSGILNNRIKVDIYATVPSGVTLYTYFGGIYSSYMKTTLPITTTNNTWLEANTFSGGITTTTLNTSGLITASHTDGITTTKLYASGLITASHADGITTTQLYSTGTVTFGGDTAPRCDVNPLWNNELANKNYVDTSIDNYTGNGLRMYFIKPVSFNPNPITASSTYELNPKMPNYSDWINTTGTGTKVLLASFVTEVYSADTVFPSGWWSMVIYHSANLNSGTSYYTFTLNQANNVGATVGDQIGNESIEATNINSTLDYLPFRCSTSFNSFTIPANTRLRLNLYISVPSGVMVSTAFGNHASYIQTTLPITSAPNTWTEKNTFSAGLTTTTLNASGRITADGGLSLNGMDKGISMWNGDINIYKTTYLDNNPSSTILGYRMSLLSSYYLFFSKYETENGYTSTTALQFNPPNGLLVGQNTNIVTIGNATNTNRIGSLDIVGATLDNKDTANVLNLGTNQIGGILNLGTNTGRTGAINIGANSCAVNVGGTLNAQQGISTQTIKATNTGTAVSLYTGQTAGTITIGSENSNVTVTSPLTTSSTLTTSGLLTASGGIGSTHIYYTSVPTTNINSIGYRTTKTVTGSFTTSSTMNSVSSLLNFTGGTAGAMIGVWLYELKFMKTVQAAAPYYLMASIKVGTGTTVPTGILTAGHDATDRVQSGQIAATHDGSNASTVLLVATKYIESNANTVHVLVSTNIASIQITTAFTSITCTVTRLA